MTAQSEWVAVCRRTEDPKLAYFEEWLEILGIPRRRNGESAHAPILEVPTGCEALAWDLLSSQIDGRTFDDIPDDDPMFNEWRKPE